MKFLPWERLVIDSPLSLAEVRSRLAQSIRPLARGDRPTPAVMLDGTFTGDAFSASVPIDYRNSFLPYVRGRIVPLPMGTRMDVTISLHPAVMAFLALWLSFAGMFCAAITVPEISAHPIQPLCLIPLGMMVFCVVITLGGYHHELARTRAAVRGLLPESPSAYR